MPATGWSSIATGELEVSMLAETAVTGVAMTTLTPGLDVEPVSLALNYFRPTRPQAGNLLARARVVNASRLFVFVETEIEDPNGRKVAHGTSHCEVRRVELSPPPPPSELRRVDEAAYSTPDPYLRAVRSRLAPPEMLAEQGGLAFLQAYLQGRFLTPFSELTGCRIDADGQLAASAHASAQLIDSSKRQKQTVSEVKRILATLLFTDIVGSTEHARRLGDGGWRAVLSQHHNAVRAEIARCEGTEVDTAGDGFFVRFDSPARALDCARAAREAVKRLGIDIRVGIHTGECDRQGRTLTGMAVHVAARIQGLAGPGDILVSSTVKDIVVGSDARFEDRGQHSLKGMPGEWRLFSLAH